MRLSVCLLFRTHLSMCEGLEKATRGGGERESIKNSL
jgi:hypothetical protein